MAFKERIEKTNDLTSWEGEIPVNYLYTYGIAGEKFFRNLMEKGTFLATKCGKCDVTYLPPRMYCERCFDELTNYTDVETIGEVHSFTVCHTDISGNKLNTPKVLAYVKIDGTDGGLIHELAVSPENAKIGMKVKADLKDSGSRKGGICDINSFKPA